METYNSDEQLQILRQWMRENGVALLGGLLLGTVLVAGWSGWNLYNKRQAERASIQYEQLRVALQNNDAKLAEEAVNRLTTTYSGTPYAALASLSLAADQVRRKQFDAAQRQYAWVMEQAGDRKLRQVATLRYARLLWSQGKSEEALRALQAQKPGSFQPMFLELQGDILVGQGRHDEARKAYTDAIAAEESPELRAGIELKLNDLMTPGTAATTSVPATPQKGG